MKKHITLSIAALVIVASMAISGCSNGTTDANATAAPTEVSNTQDETEAETEAETGTTLDNNQPDDNITSIDESAKDDPTVTQDPATTALPEDIASKAAGVINFDKVGLSIAIPPEWQGAYAQQRLVPVEQYSPDFAQTIVFAYASAEDLAEIQKPKPTDADPADDADKIKQLCAIYVVKDENKDSEAVKAQLAKYDTVKTLGAANGMTYYNAYSKVDSSTYTDVSKQEIESIQSKMDKFNGLAKIDEIKAVVIDFKGKDIQGNDINSEDIFSQNDYTIINIWATYCKPCLEEMPILQKISDKYKDKKIAVVGIASDVNSTDTLEIANQIYSNENLTFVSYVPEKDGGTIINYLTNYVTAVPTTIVVDKKGNIVGEQIVGGQNEATFTKLVDGLLAGK